MSSVSQRNRQAQAALRSQASRQARGLTVYEASGPTVVVHTVAEWVDSPRKRDRRVRPGGKLPAGTSVAVRHAARIARIESRA